MFKGRFFKLQVFKICGRNFYEGLVKKGKSKEYFFGSQRRQETLRLKKV
jgi:hypothetical protein